MALPVSLAKLVLAETAGSVIRFPYWWYTDGLSKTVQWVANSLMYRWRSYAIGIWSRNMFVPMYGQYDLTGRLVSFFMRFIILILRSVGFVAEALAYGVLLVVWCLAPVLALVMLIEPLTRPFLG